MPGSCRESGSSRRARKVGLVVMPLAWGIGSTLRKALQLFR